MDLGRDSVEGHDVGRRATVSIFFLLSNQYTFCTRCSANGWGRVMGSQGKQGHGLGDHQSGGGRSFTCRRGCTCTHS